MSPHRLRVLVIDDVQCVRSVITAAIHAYFEDEIEVETAVNLEQAMAFDPLTFDLVFVDLLLPGNRSGLEFLYFLRRKNLTTPFVIMTGFTSDQIYERLDSDTPIGLFEILIKPFGIEKIHDLVLNLVNLPALCD
ncbi:MAG: hypothetical protein UX09_C0069G0004 [Candidatus Uhrbacteria bacterium GW2011_GWE2_45_35]|uniref:Response regulatory domain-containing protein n=2 Tax=Candidatus Uhriibacteriota TaxID=1752732 RepID=A0A0G1LGM6_9BACT|nr:MAG: hypothetical protein UW63_C0095G0003 [Candidatus Uhrbacteria bacterium GW2011_GWF2_44_350]KKU05457.1 MAG: hypothetical protein UX09_C0069G0004 [Candidatus Uhrbacteria bacterium GW2011_GWE2_45_35]HBR81121.1 hypothetical protein [Candidatus Uhrbacteria bacterium]HCU31124.1 hypothetical protein [Candidatus Uhrbacteria bacterium]